MKKSSFVNLIIVCCLLTLCITTLTVIYSTFPETSVVLFEENFNALDENKWTSEVAECTEGSERLCYTSTNNQNRYAANGTLHLFTIFTGTAERQKRRTQPECQSCINWQNGGADCFPSKYSARLRTKSAFEAKRGRIEVRSTLPPDHWIRLAVLIVPVKNETEEALGGFVVSGTREEEANCSAHVQIFFGPNSNRTVIKRAVDDDFHLWEIEWDESETFFALDRQIIFEKVFRTRGNNSRPDEGLGQNVPINQPFYIEMGVDVGRSYLKGRREQSDHERSSSRLSGQETDILDVDHIRFTKILQ